MGIVSILKRCESFVKRQMLYRVHFNTINGMSTNQLNTPPANM